MTRKKLLRIVALVVLFLFMYAGLGVWLTWMSISAWLNLYKSLIPIALAVPAAILTQAIQRRVSYLQALRDLWKQLIPAVQTAIQYTHLSNAGQPDFSKVMVELSTATDVLRGVFANIPAQGKPNSLYPYENLKDIQKIISWVGYGNNFRSAMERTLARQCITRLWQEMHGAMLREFDRDVPLEPVSKFLHSGKSIADCLIEGTLTMDYLQKVLKPSRVSTHIGGNDASVEKANSNEGEG